MLRDVPYFMTNEEWYKLVIAEDDDFPQIVLTDKAPQDAVESYKEFMARKPESGCIFKG